MKIYILDREYEFKNEEHELDDIVKTIYSESNKSGRHLAYAVIDGRDVYTNFRDYIEKRIESIKSIKVVTMTFREMISNSIISIRDYIEEEKGNILFIARKFEEGPDEDVIGDLDELLEGIGWIIEYFQRVDSTQNLAHVIPDYYIWNEYALDVYRLGQVINDLEEVVMNDDEKEVGAKIVDILPVFEDMQEKLDRLYAAGA